MFDSPLGHCRRPPAVLSLTAILAAALLVAAPVHGFGLSGTQFVEGLGKVGDALKSAEEAERHDRSDTEQFVVDKAGEIADKATDAIEQASIKLSRKARDALKKSDWKRVGELAKKTAKRWGPAAMKALRLAGPVGSVVATADASITVGGAIAKYGVIPLIAMHHDSKSRELQEQILRDVEEIRKRGEFSRKLDADIAAYKREARAMEEEERRLYSPEGGGAAGNPSSEKEGSVERDPWSPATPDEPDPRENDRASERDAWANYEEERRRNGPEGGGAANDPWSDTRSSAERDPWAPADSNEPDSWEQYVAVESQDDWSSEEWERDASDAAWPPDEEGVEPAYAARLSGAPGETPEPEAEEDDYRSVVEAFERREAEEHLAAEAERLEAQREAKRQAERLEAQREAERQAERLKAQRKAKRDAERRRARLEEERREIENAREEEEWRYAQRQREERERSRSSGSCHFGGCGEAERMFEEMQRQVQQGREASRRSSGGGGHESDCVSVPGVRSCAFQ